MAVSDEFYLEIVDELVSIFDELGTTYQVRTPGAYDSDELEVVAGAPRVVVGLVATQQVSNALAAIAFPVTEASAGWIAKKSLILRSDASPVAGEEVYVDGEWFPLSKVTPIKPAEIVVVYMLDITR